MGQWDLKDNKTSDEVLIKISTAQNQLLSLDGGSEVVKDFLTYFCNNSSLHNTWLGVLFMDGGLLMGGVLLIDVLFMGGVVFIDILFMGGVLLTDVLLMSGGLQGSLGSEKNPES